MFLCLPFLIYTRKKNQTVHFLHFDNTWDWSCVSYTHDTAHSNMYYFFKRRFVEVILKVFAQCWCLNLTHTFYDYCSYCHMNFYNKQQNQLILLIVECYFLLFCHFQCNQVFFCCNKIQPQSRHPLSNTSNISVMNHWFKVSVKTLWCNWLLCSTHANVRHQNHFLNTYIIAKLCKVTHAVNFLFLSIVSI